MIATSVSGSKQDLTIQPESTSSLADLDEIDDFEGDDDEQDPEDQNE